MFNKQVFTKRLSDIMMNGMTFTMLCFFDLWILGTLFLCSTDIQHDLLLLAVPYILGIWAFFKHIKHLVQINVDELKMFSVDKLTTANRINEVNLLGLSYLILWPNMLLGMFWVLCETLYNQIVAFIAKGSGNLFKNTH